MITATVLVANAGSSSSKLSILDGTNQLLTHRELPGVDHVDRAEIRAGIREFVAEAGATIDIVAHRIVHGGTAFTGPVHLDADVRSRLAKYNDLAPLHQAKSLVLLDEVTAALPGVPAVACFDTAFHHTIPPRAYTYALPAEWRARWRVRKYGFHGLSHAYATGRATSLAGGNRPGLRIISCHLGAGASVAAVVGGRCVDTTMGFTPLDGLVMATRSGAVDPGLVLWLEEHERLAPQRIATALEYESGLFGLAGTSDMREIEARTRAGDEIAAAALDVYLHRLVTAIGSMAAAAGGLDVLLFTGGVGENSATVRARAASALGWLGVTIDALVNIGKGPADRDISASGATVRSVVVQAREDIEMARQARRLLATS
jgi:acetate kinase